MQKVRKAADKVALAFQDKNVDTKPVTRGMVLCRNL